MLTTCVLTGTAASFANKCNELRKVGGKLDVYPEKLSPMIEKIKKAIDQPTYEYLTNPECYQKPNNPMIETFTPGATRIAKFKEFPDFIVKSSVNGLNNELRWKGGESLDGYNIRATNNEGAVTQDLFRFAQRVTNAKKLRKIIKQNHLDRIKIPKKYLCSFPKALVPTFSTPLHHRNVFVLCERCDVEYAGEKTIEELKKMTSEDLASLAKQIQIFLSQSGVLDFLPHNFYIKNGILVIFDTEPMSLKLPSYFCNSPELRVARVNFQNVVRCFNGINEAKPLVDMANRSISEIRTKEKERVPRLICMTLLFISAVVVLHYYTQIPFDFQIPPIIRDLA